MTERARAGRRSDPLSRDRLVRAAIEILDADGADALTFRLLAGRLATGPGAIYHHVASKDELLRAATAMVIGGALEGVGDDSDPAAAIRALALTAFDAIDAHPWIGGELAREPWQFAVTRLFEAIGRQLDALGVPPGAQFDVATALLGYILGLAGQYAAGVRVVSRGADRQAFLDDVAREWERLDDDEFPFMRGIASELRDHDDRAQFIAGVELILAGIQAAHGGRAVNEERP